MPRRTRVWCDHRGRDPIAVPGGNDRLVAGAGAGAGAVRDGRSARPLADFREPPFRGAPHFRSSACPDGRVRRAPDRLPRASRHRLRTVVVRRVAGMANARYAELTDACARHCPRHECTPPWKAAGRGGGGDPLVVPVPVPVR